MVPGGGCILYSTGPTGWPVIQVGAGWPAHHYFCATDPLKNNITNVYTGILMLHVTHVTNTYTEHILSGGVGES